MRLRRSALRAGVTLGLFLLALAAGFVVSSQLGQRWMREEAQLELSKLLEGEVAIERVALRIRRGVELHGVGVRVDYPDPGRDALMARQVAIRLDTGSLLLGRFRCAELEVDGLALALRRSRDGVWSPPYFPSQAELDGERAADRASLEHELGWMRVLVEVAHFLMREQQIADRIDLRNATVTFLDERPRDGATARVAHRMEHVHGTLDRSWLGRSVDLSLSGRWLGGDGRGAAVEIHASKRNDPALRLAIAVSDLDLAHVAPYVMAPRAGAKLAGSLTGVVDVVTPEVDRARIEIDAAVEAIDARFPLRDTSLELASPHTAIHAQLDLAPDRLRIESLEAADGRVELAASARFARPLRRSSATTLSATIEGIGLEELQRVAAGLPEEDAATFRRLVDRISHGRIASVGVRGGESLQAWLDVASGERTTLPEGIRLGAEFEDVTIGTSETDTLSDVSAKLTWNGELLEMRELRGRFNGDPLPRIDIAVNGIGALLAAAPPDERLTRAAHPLPGLGTLWDIVRGDEPADESHPPMPIRVELDELQHPALRWPLRDAVVVIDPTQRDLYVAITRGEWAGSPVRGEAVLAREPEPELRIELVVRDGAGAPEGGDAGAAAPSPPNEPARASWAHGAFETSAVRAGPLVFETLAGEFALVGPELALDGVSASLAGGGTLTGAGTFSLAREGEVDARARLAVSDAEADRVAQLFGIASGFATGRADVEAELTGVLRREGDLVDELVGTVELRAREGSVKQSVPLLASLAHAIEGWSPFAANEALRFERIAATIALDRGLVSTDRFALEGPLRVLASGRVDARAPDSPIDATVGIFLLRQADRLLGDIPLVNLLIPGSDRGLIGAYFEVSGPVAEPKVRTMPIKSLADGIPLPPVLREPFDALRGLFTGSSRANDPRRSTARKPGEDAS